MYDVTEIVPTFWLVKTLQDGFFMHVDLNLIFYVIFDF